MPDPLDDGALAEVVELLREPVHVDPSFDARVMAAVRGGAVHRPTSLWAHLREPRTVTIRPLRWALLAAGLVVAVGLDAARHLRQAIDAHGDALAATAAAHAPVQQRRVQFVLVAPTARKVAVVGDFNGWDPSHAAYRAHHQGGGVWAVTAAVPVGHHRYSFVVDDSVWVADPTAPRVLDDDFGLPNSAIVVGESTP